MANEVALIAGIAGRPYLAELLLKKGYIVYGIKRRIGLCNSTRVEYLYQSPRIDYRNCVLHNSDLTAVSGVSIAAPTQTVAEVVGYKRQIWFDVGKPGWVSCKMISSWLNALGRVFVGLEGGQVQVCRTMQSP